MKRIVAVCLFLSGFAQAKSLETNFELRPTFDQEEETSLSRVEVDNILRDFSKIFEPEFKAKNQKLVLLNDWDDPMINALAYQNLPVASVDILGGMSRHPKMTFNALKGILCHEIGHHLGGTPYKEIPDAAWMSAEAQSDYYMTLNCLRKIYANEKFSLPHSLPQSLGQKCDEYFNSVQERNICKKSIQASYEMIQVFHHVFQEAGVVVPQPSLNSRDHLQVSLITRDGYPSLQCRLDTMIEGALCNKECQKYALEPNLVIVPLSGHRPSCWFNQQDFMARPRSFSCKTKHRKADCLIQGSGLMNQSGRETKLKGQCQSQGHLLISEVMDLGDQYYSYGMTDKKYEYEIYLQYDSKRKTILSGQLLLSNRANQPLNRNQTYEIECE